MAILPEALRLNLRMISVTSRKRNFVSGAQICEWDAHSPQNPLLGVGAAVQTR